MSITSPTTDSVRPGVAPAANPPTLMERVFALTPDLAAVVVDVDFCITYCSAAAELFFGFEAAELLGRRVTAIHDDLGVPNEAFQRAADKVRRGGEHVFPQRVVLSDGPHILESRMSALWEGAQLVGYLLLTRDRTRELKAESRERLLARTMEYSPAAVIVTDTEGRIEFVNQRFTEMTGYVPDEVIGGNPRILKSGQTPRQTYQDMWAALNAGKGWSGELLNRHRSGELRWHAVRVTPVLGPDGGIEHFVGVQEDVTDRRLGEERLRLSAKVFEDSGEAIMITDARNCIVSVNRAFSEITGYGPEEVIGRNPNMLGSGRHGRDFFAAMWRAIDETGRWQGEIWDRRKSGEVYPKWLGISAVRDGAGRLTHYLAIFSDITDRKVAEERIAFLAYHDPLTGLPNRILLRDRFEQAAAFARRTQTRVAVLFLDLDRFKTVNDTLGHAIGDRLLKAVVERLRHCVRRTDTVSRQGGDEFTILLTDIRSDEMAAESCRKILERLAAPIAIDEHEIATSFSIGISLYPNDGEDFDTLLKKADTAMYDAKEAGRNGFRFFAERMNERVSERLMLQSRLVKALPAGEFLLHYQPQVSLPAGRIVGAEALLRWNSRDWGLMPPDRFIPVAEETGLIVSIGAWVLREACRQGAAWLDQGLALTVAVNLSALQFRRGDLLGTVRQALDESGLPPHCLELEITESILIHDVDKALESVLSLKALGVRFSVDDFGTGYSSLAYLKRFAVDKLKIDRSFIREVATNPDDAAIVRAIIQMAGNLKLATVAEGVEGPEQVNFLCQEGCDVAQGYYFSRPLPAVEFASLLLDSSR